MKYLIEKNITMGIYQIRNLVNGKKYVGSAFNFYNRFRCHLSNLNKNKHDNDHLQKSFNKYGSDNFVFELIEKVEDSKILYSREEKYIREFFGDNCYNMKINNNNPFIEYNFDKMKSFSLIGTDNQEYFFTGYTNASKSIGVNSDGIRLVVIGKLKSYKGWRLPENINYDYKNYRKKNGRGGKFHDVKLLSPDGVVYDGIHNLEEFSRIHKTISASNISNLIKGRTRYVNGWSIFTGNINPPLEKNAKIYNITLISPNGEKHSNIKNLTKFCKEKNICITSIRNLINGKSKKDNYKGWVIKD
jgi:group I intron endonuclease